jgi:hypothetical protein
MLTMYMLDEHHNVITTDDSAFWARWLRRPDNKRVAFEFVNGFRVSTVFLGINHGFDDASLLLFETMVFDESGARDLYCRRYATWEHAANGHKETVETLRINPASIINPDWSLED